MLRRNFALVGQLCEFNMCAGGLGNANCGRKQRAHMKPCTQINMDELQGK
jgi:hypothetical protein